MTYLLLPENADPAYFEKRIHDLFKPKWIREFNYTEAFDFTLRPLRDIYMSTELENEWNNFLHGNRKMLNILLAVALFTLIIAIINYINLTTARASLRAREVSIRRVVGSTKMKLIGYFLTESLIVAFLSFLLALTIVQMVLPGFNRLASTDLSILPAPIHELIFFAVLAISLTALLSGIYPSLYMTRFRTVISLTKGREAAGRQTVFRRILLSFQYTISVMLIIGVIVILNQLNYMKNADLGFNKELVITSRDTWFVPDLSKRDLVRAKLLQNPDIKAIAFAQFLVGGEQFTALGKVTVQGTEKQVLWRYTEPDFFDLMGIELLDGRNFSRDRDRPTDGTEDSSKVRKVIINETAMREFGLESPVGEFMDTKTRKLEIIGVIKDFHCQSQHEKIVPTIYNWHGGFMRYWHIKIAPENVPATLRFIKKELGSMMDNPFNYSFLDDTFEIQYETDERTAKVIGIFAIVAVLISCMGLFGLSTFMAARRTKEIGIRKAMGASERTLFLLLSLEFVKWISLSVIIACPVAWIIMNRWLQNFAYRTNISWWIFALAILIAFLIAFSTITWQSLKTARTNPVEALRYE
jgi:putative ABC transport system permease protein